MSTFQMDSHTGFTGNLTIPGPSGAIVAAVGGIATVNAQDAPVALRSGWTLAPNSGWPAGRVWHLSVPSNGNWPTSGTLTLPDNSTITVTAGAVLMPGQWLNWATGLGFYPTPGIGNLD